VNRLSFLFKIVVVVALCKTALFGQKENLNIPFYDSLLKNSLYDQLHIEFLKNNNQYSFIQFLRTKAAFCSEKREDDTALEIMKYCVNLGKISEECDTVWFNNLHQLGIYYAYLLKREKSLEINQICLKNRLACNIVNAAEISRSYNNIGLDFKNLNQLDSSTYYFNKALEYLNKGGFSNHKLTNAIYSNYLLNLTMTGKLNQGKRFAKKWSRKFKNQEDWLLISMRLNQNIYECLTNNKIKGALKYNLINRRIIEKAFGNNSEQHIEYEWNFIKALGEHEFDQLALKHLTRMQKRHLKDLHLYQKLIFKSGIATALMNLDHNFEALKIYRELKPQFLENYSDSSTTMLLLSNLSVCYNKLGDLNLMKSTREEFYKLSEDIELKPEIQSLYETNLDRDLFITNQMGDFDKYEITLLKAIDFYNKIADIDYELHSYLKLSNLYLFEKFDLKKCADLLDHVKSKLPSAENKQKVRGFYYYQLAEYERRLGNFQQHQFYKLTMDCFDSIQFFPVEYENSIYRYANFNLQSGNFDQGKLFLDKYLEFGKLDTNNLRSFNNYINYFNSIEAFQSDSINDLQATELLNQIERLHGISNPTYRKAAKFFYIKIINPEMQRNIILKWINSFHTNNELDYFFAKTTLADFYFEQRKFSQCESLWDSIMEEASVLNQSAYNEVAVDYIYYLMFDKNQFDKALDKLNELNFKWNDFESVYNNCFLNCFLGTKNFEKAEKYLAEKENYILGAYSDYSEQYLNFLDQKIDYFESIGNSFFEKFYRERQLEIYYQIAPRNKDEIISKTGSLSLLLNDLKLAQRGFYWINRAKIQFQMAIETTQSFDDLLFSMFETMSKVNIYINQEDENLTLMSIEEELVSIKNKCIQLKLKLNKENSNVLFDWLSYLIDFHLKIIHDPSIISVANATSDFMQFAENNDMFIDAFASPNFSINQLIANGKIKEAKNQAHLVKDFNMLSNLEWENGDESMAFAYGFEEEKMELMKIIESSSVLTDIELEQKRKIQKNSLNFLLGRFLINLISPSNNMVEKSFELVLNNYGLLSQLNKDFFQHIKNDSTELRNLYLYVSRLKNQGLLNSRKIEKSYEELSELEFQLNLKLLNRKHSDLSWVSFEDIRKMLNDSDIFILNYKYDYQDWIGNSIDSSKRSYYYLTFIVSNSLEAPNLVITPIDNEAEGEIVEYYHKAIIKKADQQNMSFVYGKIWSQIDKYITDKVKKVILKPDGMYNAVNISTLFDENKDKYIFDKYDIVITDDFQSINNEKLSQKSSSINSAALLGFPNYSGLTTTNNALNTDTLTVNLNNYYSNATRGAIIKSLPETKIEIEKIRHLLIENGINTYVLLKDNATEDNLKKVNNPDILHIATHGFFINSNNSLPMFNSGLLLGGSSNQNKLNEDGYLSAYETSLLNLDSTKLVVLSACETGRGVLKDGDGVFGLKQGCLNAGAQNIIMSLWKVDDKVTQEFMTRFYQLWLNDKTTIREAFHKTQLEIKAKYPQPYYWGAFILVGE
jgi:CHAT domain-containing protein